MSNINITSKNTGKISVSVKPSTPVTISPKAQTQVSIKGVVGATHDLTGTDFGLLYKSGDNKISTSVVTYNANTQLVTFPGGISPASIFDTNGSRGTAGQILSSTGTALDWISLTEIAGVNGSGTANYVAKWTDSDSITDSSIYDDGTNVGIGTSSPTAKLDINAANTESAFRILQPYAGNANADYIGELTINSTSRGGLKVEGKGQTTNSNAPLMLYGNDISDGGTARVVIKANTNSGTRTLMSVRNSSDLDLFVVRGDGDVGIGTTAPTEKLHVNGGIKVNGNILLDGNSRIVKTIDDTDLILGSNNTGRVWIKNSGNVGIGTTNPSWKLHVNSTQRAGIFGFGTPWTSDGVFYVGAYYASHKPLLVQHHSATANSYSYFFAQFRNGDDENVIQLRTDGSADFNGRLNVNSTNNLGRITVNPTTDSGDAIGIDERGFIAFADEGTLSTRLRGIPGGTFQFQGSSYDTFFNISKGGNSYLNSTGNFGIGTTSPEGKLHVYNPNGSGTTRTSVFEHRWGVNALSQYARYGAIIKSADLGTSLGITNQTYNTVLQGFQYTSPFTAKGISLNPLGGIVIVGRNAQSGDVDPFLVNSSTAGDAFIVKESGNVGIGTTSPNAPLDVISNSSGNGIDLRSNSANAYAQIKFYNNDHTTNTGAIINYQNSGSPYFAFRLLSGAGTVERMRITSAGNVGIGTLSPSEKLEVDGNIKISEGSQFKSIATQNNVNATEWEQSLEFFLPYRSDGTTVAENKSALKLGGTKFFEPRTHNTSVMHVYGGLSFASSSSSGGSGIRLYFGDQSDTYPANSITTSWNRFGNTTDRQADVYGYFGASFSSTQPSGYFKFSNSTGELFRISSNGNVGIGTTSPQQKLHVEGTIRIGADVDLSRYAGRLYTAQDIVLGSQNSEGANLTINASNTKNVLGVRRPSSGTVSVLKVRDYYTQDVYVDIDSDGNADFAGNVTIGGTATFDSDLTVSGNLTVNGTTTTLNTTELTIEDKNIVLANGAVDAVAANGAGITIDGADATLTYNSSGDLFEYNKNLKVIYPGGGREATLTGFQLLFSRNSYNYVQATDASGRIRIVTGGNLASSATADFLENKNSIFYGNVGIGTTAPQSKLTIGSQGGTIATIADFRGDSDDDFIQVARATDTARGVKIFASGKIYASSTHTSEAAYIFNHTASNATTTGDREFFQINGGWSPSSGTSTWAQTLLTPTINTTGTYVGTVRGIYYNPTVTSATGATHRAIETTAGDVIFNGGNVGIGTTTPSTKLDVNGNIKVYGGVISLDGSAGYLGNSIKYESSQIRIYQSGDMLAAFGGRKVGIGTTAPASTFHTVGKSTEDIATLGNELLNAQTASGTGWTGVDIEQGYTHIPGNSDTLVTTFIPNINTVYVIDIAVTGLTAGRIDFIYLGGQSRPVYTGNTASRKVAIRTTTTDPLEVLAQSATDGTISFLSIKEVSSSTPSVTFGTSTDSAALEFRVPNVNNIYIGKNAGTKRTSEFNTTNIGIGYSSLANNVEGTQNVALGYNTLGSTANSSYNIAVGGGILQYYKHSGNTYNIGIGHNIMSGSAITTANGNIALGFWGMSNITTASSNVGIGYDIFKNLVSGTSNVSIGSASSFNLTTGGANVAIGLYALNGGTTSHSNVAIGYGAGRYVVGNSPLTTGNFSIFIGRDTKGSAVGTTNEIVIGHEAEGIGSNSVVLGNDLITTTALKGNVGIGTDSPSAKLEIGGSKTIPIEGYNEPEYISINPTITDNNSNNNSKQEFLKIAPNYTFNYGSANPPGARKAAISITPNYKGVTGVNNDANGVYALYSKPSFDSNIRNVNHYGIYLDSPSYSNTSGRTYYPIYVAEGTSYFGGRVGIGTTSPSATLHVKDTGQGVFIENTGNTGAILTLANTEGTSRVFTNNGITTIRNIRTGFSDYSIDVGGLGVKIKEGSGGQNAHASAILDLDSTTQGVLFPRMTEGDRTSIASPATGLIVYQTDGDEGLYIYKSTGWLQII